MEAFASSKYTLLILKNILLTTRRYNLFYKVKIFDDYLSDHKVSCPSQFCFRFTVYAVD